MKSEPQKVELSFSNIENCFAPLLLSTGKIHESDDITSIQFEGDLKAGKTITMHFTTQKRGEVQTVRHNW